MPPIRTPRAERPVADAYTTCYCADCSRRLYQQAGRYYYVRADDPEQRYLPAATCPNCARPLRTVHDTQARPFRRSIPDARL